MVTTYFDRASTKDLHCGVATVGVNSLRLSEDIVKPLRILIADDHDLMRRGVKSLLESQVGWEACGEAKTGHEAVNKTKDLRPDIPVLDISMPDLNGLEAARRIRKASPSTESMHYSDQLIREIVDAWRLWIYRKIGLGS